MNNYHNKSRKQYNSKMAETLIRFQLPCVPSSGKHVLHWEERSLSCTAFSTFTNTGKVSQNSALAASQGFIIMHS